MSLVMARNQDRAPHKSPNKVPRADNIKRPSGQICLGPRSPLQTLLTLGIRVNAIDICVLSSVFFLPWVHDGSTWYHLLLYSQFFITSVFVFVWTKLRLVDTTMLLQFHVIAVSFIRRLTRLTESMTTV